MTMGLSVLSDQKSVSSKGTFHFEESTRSMASRIVDFPESPGPTSAAVSAMCLQSSD
jgi:hypothetical protein